MKIVYIIFVMLSFSIAKILVINETEGAPPIIFPTFEPPTFSPRDLSGGCGGFTDCIEYVGAVIQNIGETIIFLILFIIALITFIFKILALLVAIQFTGVDGAPFWVNALLATPFLASIGIIIYKLLRKGDDEA